MTGWRRVFMLAVVLGFGLTGVVWAQSASQMPVSFDQGQVGIVTADGRRLDFSAELARTPEQLTQGLMFRRRLEANAGMLFDFGVMQPVSMWMKNTLIPLDMVFIAEDGGILGVAERTVPQSTAIIRSPGPVRAVLEVNGGTAQRLGIHRGDRMVSPQLLR